MMSETLVTSISPKLLTDSWFPRSAQQLDDEGHDATRTWLQMDARGSKAAHANDEGYDETRTWPHYDF